MTQFKVGDRVRNTNKNSTSHISVTGTIIKVHCPIDLILVRTDKEYGDEQWWCRAKNLTKIN